MTWFAATLEAQVLALVVGTSVILGGAGLFVAFGRDLVHQQRHAELGCGAAVLWCLLVAVPLPRCELPQVHESERQLDGPLEATTPGGVAAEPTNPVAPREPRKGLVHPIPTMLLAARPQTPSEGAAPAWNVGTWVVSLVLGTAALAIAYLVLGGLLIARVLVRSRPAPLAAAKRFAELACERLAHVPSLRVARGPVQPFCLGFGRGIVLVPESLLHAGHEERLEVVLRHEIAHVARRDGRGRLVFAAALPLLALHPFFWWLRARAHFAAEALADELAAHASGRARYVREMIEFAAGARSPRLPWVAAMPVFRSRSEFFRRMQMLMQREGRLATSCSSLRRFAQNALALVVVAVPAAFVGTPALAAQEGQPPLPRTEVDTRVQAETTVEVAKLLEELTLLRTALSDAKRELTALKEQGAKRTDRDSRLLEEIAVKRANRADAERSIAEALDPVRPRDPGRANAEPEAGSAFPPERSANDVVALLNARIDLEAEQKVARFRLQRAEKLAGSGTVTEDEVYLARTKLEANEAKLQVALRAIATERNALRSELELVTMRLKRGGDPTTIENLKLRAQRLEDKLRMFG